MNDEQQKELIFALVDLRRRVAILEKNQSKFEKLLESLAKRFDNTVVNLGKNVSSLKIKLSYIKERMSFLDAKVQQNHRK